MDGSVRIADTPVNTETITQCTTTNCVQDDDQYKLECNECHRLVHYRCTHLPLYQLSLFLTKGYRRFTCENCVVVPKYIQEMSNVAISIPEDQSETVHKLTTAPNKKETENECQKENIDALAAKQKQITEELQEQRERL